MRVFNFLMLLFGILHAPGEAKELKGKKKGGIMHRLGKLQNFKLSSARKALVFTETSTEAVKSKLDKTLEVIGPYKKMENDVKVNIGGLDVDLNPTQPLKNLLNKPANPVMRINGYPVNPTGSATLSQMDDGSLIPEMSLQETPMYELIQPTTRRYGNRRQYGNMVQTGRPFPGMGNMGWNSMQNRNTFMNRMRGGMYFGNSMGKKRDRPVTRSKKDHKLKKLLSNLNKDL